MPVGRSWRGASQDETEESTLKAKIALEALREQATVADPAQRYQLHPKQIYGTRVRERRWRSCLMFIALQLPWRDGDLDHDVRSEVIAI